MLNIHFTLPMVLNMLGNIAKRAPEKVAQKSDGTTGCIYMERDGHIVTPVCIVGQMFADLGLLRLLALNPSDLSDDADQHTACTVGGEFWTALETYGITADEDAASFMRSVQYKQDGGSTWSEAFDSIVQEFRDERTARLDDEQEALDAKRVALANLFA